MKQYPTHDMNDSMIYRESVTKNLYNLNEFINKDQGKHVYNMITRLWKNLDSKEETEPQADFLLKLNKEEKNDLVQEAITYAYRIATTYRIEKYMDRRKETEMGINLFIYKALKNTLFRLYYASKAHRLTVTDKDGNKRKISVDIADYMATRPATAESNLLSMDIKTACKDDTDRTIVAYRIIGYTEKEIGVLVGMSQQAIHKRITALKDRVYNRK